MSVMTPPDSASLRITYTVPIESGDTATLKVRVKQASVSIVEQFFGVAIEVRARDTNKSTIHGPVNFASAHPGGPFDKTFTLTVPLATLNEDGAGVSSRDAILVRVRKTAAPGLPKDSNWVESNRVDVYFGKGEVTPET